MNLHEYVSHLIAVIFILITPLEQLRLRDALFAEALLDGIDGRVEVFLACLLVEERDGAGCVEAGD